MAWTGQPYSALPGLENVYLEDSYVLAIVEQGGVLRFDLDLVLTESHPDYRPPLPAEQYCFRRAALEFRDYVKVEWVTRSDATYTDATGETDRGNIDSLRLTAGRYDVQGDWGHVRVTGGILALTVLR